MKPLTISVGQNVLDVNPQRRTIIWTELTKAFLLPPRVGKLPLVDYLTANKSEKAAEKDGIYYVFGVFQNDERNGAAWREACAIVLDHDAGMLTEADIRAAMRGLAAIVTTTHSHTEAKPKWRIILLLASPVTDREQYKATVQVAEKLFPAGTKFDPRSRLPEQLWFAPSCPPDALGIRRAFALDGERFAPAPKPVVAPAPVNATAPLSGDAQDRKSEIEGLLSLIKLDDARQKLSELDGGREVGNRDAWVKIGMAARSYEPTAVDEFTKWSQSQPGFASDADCKTQWDSFGRNGTGRAATIDTLRFLARAVVTADIFPTVAQEPTAPAAPNNVKAKIKFMSDVSLKSRPPYLIKGLFNKGKYAVLYGAPGERKTFLAVSMSYHIAAGKEWMGHRVNQGLVLYVGFESFGSLDSRLLALRNYYGADVPMAICPGGFDLRQLEGRRAFGEILAALPCKPSLIVFDTFAYALAGGDENSGKDITAFNIAVLAIIEATGAGVLLIHHCGKDKKKGLRGHSALGAAVDTELFADNFVISQDKQRDMPEGPDISFKLESVRVGVDDDGDLITSCVVLPEGGITVARRPTPTGRPAQALSALYELAPTNVPMSESVWEDAFASKVWPLKNDREGTANCKKIRTAFGRVVATLRDMGLIEPVGDMWRRRMLDGEEPSPARGPQPESVAPKPSPDKLPTAQPTLRTPTPQPESAPVMVEPKAEPPANDGERPSDVPPMSQRRAGKKPRWTAEQRATRDARKAVEAGQAIAPAPVVEQPAAPATPVSNVAAPAAEPPAPQPGASFEDAKAAFRELFNTKGAEAATSVLKGFNLKAIGDLRGEHCAPFILACQQTQIGVQPTPQPTRGGEQSGVDIFS